MTVAAAEVSLSPAFDDYAKRFRQALVQDGAKPTTVADYYRHSRKFLNWAESTGRGLSTLPPDAPEKYYLHIGLAHGNPARNMPNSALKAFIRFMNSNGSFEIPQLDFPPSIAPRRKPRVAVAPADSSEPPLSMDPFAQQENYDMQNLPPIGSDPLAAAPAVGFPGIASATSAPAPVAPPPAAPSPFAAAVADPTVFGHAPTFYEEAPAAPAPAPVAPPQVAAPQPPPVYPQQQPMRAPAIEVRSLANPRVVDKKQSGNRSVLSQMLPQGGTLRISRVSDGTDGAAPGKRVVVGTYDEGDLRGYKEIATFVKEQIHEGSANPLTNTNTVTFIVEHYDDFGRPTGAPRQIALPNLRGVGGNGRQGQNGDVMSQLLATVTEQIRSVETRRVESETKLREAIEKAGKGDQSAWMAMLMAQNNQPRENLSMVLDNFATKMQAMGGGNLGGVPLPPPPPVVDETSRGAMDIAKIALERSFDRPTPTAPPPAQDPFDLAIKMKSAFSPPVDPMVVELREANRRLETQMTEMKNSVLNKPAPSFMSQMAEWEKFDEFIQRRGGDSGGGFAEAIKVFAERLPEALDSLARLRAGIAPPSAEQIAAMRGQAPAQVGPAQQAPPTPEMIAAFESMASATNDMAVLNSVYALINALPKAPAPWPQLVQQLDAEIKNVQTIDEMQNLVGILFGACSQQHLQRKVPGLVRRISDALAANFDVLCTSLGMPVRQIAGTRGSAINESATSTTPTAPAAAPTPAQEEPFVPDFSLDDEEGGDEEEAASEAPAGTPTAVNGPGRTGGIVAGRVVNQ